MIDRAMYPRSGYSPIRITDDIPEFVIGNDETVRNSASPKPSSHTDNEVGCVTFRAYHDEAMKTKMYPQDVELIYPILGLLGEAGELANIIKKWVRVYGTDIKINMSVSSRERLIDEMGDVLWYLVATADDLGVPMDEIATRNISKLMRRMENQTIASLQERQE